MATPVGSITRAATRKEGEPLRILSFPTHERYQTGLAGCNATFYLLSGPQIKQWNPAYGPLPSNHELVDGGKDNRNIPNDFDLVFSQNKFGQHQLAQGLCRELHLNMVAIEHTLPVTGWGPQRIRSLKHLRGDINVFISEYSRDKWGWGPDEAEVIVHGVDTHVFSPAYDLPKYPRVLSVVNDFIQRDWCVGYSIYKEATKGIPTHPIGDTPGLSKAAADIPDLVDQYRRAQIFINTSIVSPIPTALLEAMSCGCACVSTNNCMIGEAVVHGENGLLSNDPKELRAYCQQLLADPALCEKLGKAARKTIQEKFSLEKFVSRWDEVFRRAANTPYRGVV